MHIDLDLKLTLTGSPTDNEHQLALALRALAHLLAGGSSAQANVALTLQSTAPAVELVSVPAPQIVRNTELLTVQVEPAPAATVAEPAPAATVAEPAPAATVAEPAPAATVAEPAPAAEEEKSSRLPFEEYDRLVRAEMKRLSRNGIMCGRVRWDAERDRRLPTFTAVVYRYGFKRPEELANKLGYLAPERSRQPSETNHA